MSVIFRSPLFATPHLDTPLFGAEGVASSGPLGDPGHKPIPGELWGPWATTPIHRILALARHRRWARFLTLAALLEIEED